MRKMKNSGLEWIGEIPEDWEVRKVKHYYKMQTGFTPDTNKQDYYDDEYGFDWVNISDLSLSRTIDSTKNKISQLYINNYSPQIIPKGSLLYSFKLSVGQVAFAGKDIYSNEAIASFIFNKSNNLDFLYYSSYMIVNNANENIYGAKLLNQELIKNAYIVFPPLPIQHRIATYLDDKCAKIDNIIAREQAIIENLKAYKLSVITEAVTKGINPDVPMKDSGIDLCNKIPGQWTVSRIKYLFQLRDEKNYLPLEEVRLLSLYTEFGVFPHGEQDERGNKAITADGYKAVYEKDIVVNIILAWMGAIGVSNYDGVTSPAYDIYKPFSNVNSKFYHYLFRTKAFSAECYKYGRGIMAMRWRTYSTEFKSIFVPVPPVEEQQQIVDYLDLKCAKIDSAIDKKQAVIDKLTEYKKSLIYEVVTGKKEV